MSKQEAHFISTQVTSGEYYYLNLTPIKDEPETVVCGGREQCSPAYRIERNTFKFHSIEFALLRKRHPLHAWKNLSAAPGRHLLLWAAR